MKLKKDLMNIRDRELLQLERYAQGLGIRVVYKKHERGMPGALWENTSNGVVLTMYYWPGQSKTILILNYLHELAHHLAFVYNDRELPPSVNKAFAKDDQDLSDNDRRIIYETEKDDAKYRLTIAHELNIKIPEWKIQLDIELDTWWYYRLYKDGDYPSLTELQNKKYELRRKYEV